MNVSFENYLREAQATGLTDTTVSAVTELSLGFLFSGFALTVICTTPNRGSFLNPQVVFMARESCGAGSGSIVGTSIRRSGVSLVLAEG